MGGEIVGLAGVARRALAVGEPTFERPPVDVAVALSVRLVAVDAVHRAAEITVAGEVIHLISEGAHAAVGVERPVADQLRQQGVVILEPPARQITRLDDRLHRMALEAHLEGCVFVQQAERPHAELRGASQPASLGPFHVLPRRPVTRFAVDGQTRDVGIVPARVRVEPDRHLAAVAFLAVGEPLVGAEHAHRRPVGAVSQRHVFADGNPSLIGAGVRIAEPDAFAPDEIEREKAERAVGERGEKALRAAADHVPTADHAGDGKDDCVTPVLYDGELIVPGVVHRRDDHRVLEPDGSSFEARKHQLPRREAARAPVCGLTPCVVLHLMALDTRLRTHEVLNRGTIADLERQWRREFDCSASTAAAPQRRPHRHHEQGYDHEADQERRLADGSAAHGLGGRLAPGITNRPRS